MRMRPRSRCPHCNHPIRAFHNIPILSWLLLKGRCADCNEPVSARYPYVVTDYRNREVSVRTELQNHTDKTQSLAYRAHFADWRAGQCTRAWR